MALYYTQLILEDELGDMAAEGEEGGRDDHVQERGQEEHVRRVGNAPSPTTPIVNFAPGNTRAVCAAVENRPYIFLFRFTRDGLSHLAAEVEEGGRDDHVEQRGQEEHVCCVGMHHRLFGGSGFRTRRFAFKSAPWCKLHIVAVDCWRVVVQIWYVNGQRRLEADSL